MLLRLIIEDSQGAMTIVPLRDSPVTIGREPSNTIQLTEKNISRHHATLRKEDEGWVVENHQSYNGLTINQHTIDSEALLQIGDRVQIGDYYLSISDEVKEESSGGFRTGEAAAQSRSGAELPVMSASEFKSIRGGEGESYDEDEDEKETQKFSKISSERLAELSSSSYVAQGKPQKALIALGALVVLAGLGWWFLHG